MASQVTADPGLHLVVDGARILPTEVADSQYVFRYPLTARSVHLVSRAVVPSSIDLNDDRRLLGFAVRMLRLSHGGRTIDIPAEAPELFDGFHDCETDGWRWTNGSAAVPTKLFDGAAGEVELTVLGFGLPHYGAIDTVADADRSLFLAFESLGENCEFAFAQRHYGAEPMGLLRWTSTDLRRLQCGIEARYAGLGDPDLTTLEWSEDHNEYRLRDPRYLDAHTAIGIRCADAAEEAALKVRTAARVQLLRRKLLADIALGSKILVLKVSGHEAGLTEFRRLKDALAAIGPSPLLCVQTAPAGVAAGHVEDCGGGLLLGSIDRFVSHEGPYTMWRTICRTAFDLVHRPAVQARRYLAYLDTDAADGARGEMSQAPGATSATPHPDRQISQ